MAKAKKSKISKMKHVNQYNSGIKHLDEELKEIENKEPIIEIVQPPPHWSENYVPPEGKKLVMLNEPCYRNGMYKWGAFLLLDDEEYIKPIEYSVMDFIGPSNKVKFNGLRKSISYMYRLWEKVCSFTKTNIMSKLQRKKI